MNECGRGMSLYECESDTFYYRAIHINLKEMQDLFQIIISEKLLKIEH
jgi:hypothetical protein